MFLSRQDVSYLITNDQDNYIRNMTKTDLIARGRHDKAEYV